MPFIDDASGDVIVRVVYDGAPEAGKTTNVRELASNLALQRRSVLQNPGSEGRMTEYFDWLDFLGGYLDGRRVRCQLVSVPGQAKLAHRRRHLVTTADAVVFVADAHPLLVEENREALHLLRGTLDELGRVAPVGLVLQANKQDRPNALPPEVLARRLELPPHVPVFAARADAGRGVRESFLLAVRLATERVRALALRDAITVAPAGWSSPDALLDQLKRLDDADVAWVRGELPITDPKGREPDGAELVVRASPTTDVHVPAPPPLALPEEEPDSTSDSTSDSGASPSAPPAPPLSIPDPASIPAGCNWPPVIARALLAGLYLEGCAPEPIAATWAPRGALELRSPRGVTAHTHDDWRHASTEEARLALLRLVRAWLPLRALLPEGRSAVVADERGAPRLWVLTPPVLTIARAIDDALAGRSDPTAALQASCEVLLAHADAVADGAPIGADPEQLAWVGERSARLVTLWIPGTSSEGTSLDLADALRRRWSPLPPDAPARMAATALLRREREAGRRALLERLLA
jgi:signal recognition particle receptor subunit beta